MSSAEKLPSSSAVPQRPNLIKPPARPVNPAPAATPADPAAASAAPTEAAAAVPDSAVSTLPQPISPPSEPRQYRAIGLVRGTYEPSEEQFNRGNVITADGSVVDSVLLGRITSLVKKHIDLTASHLWVVYPRTRQDEKTLEVDLHLQIVGVWEPETLGLPGEESGDGDAASAPDSAADPQDNYFSIRGEVIKYEEDEQMMVVKILQGSKKEGKGIKAFRLNVAGTLPNPKTVGYFWELDVERRDKALVLSQATLIGIVPPKKRKVGGGKRDGGRRPMGGRRSSPAPKGKPRTRPMTPVKSNPL